MRQITGVTAQRYADKVIHGAKDGRYVSHSESGSLDFTKSKVYTITTGSQKLVSATIPIHGRYSTTSNLTVIFDGHGESITYSESLVSRSEKRTFHVDKYSAENP